LAARWPAVHGRIRDQADRVYQSTRGALAGPVKGGPRMGDSVW
jgi:hypothetical protein